MLLRKADLPGPAETGALLDLGCGYGPIACVLATVAPAATVYAIDVNARARALAAANGGPLGVRVSAPDEVDDSVGFAQIWSNPPFKIGKTELHALLDRWLPRLRAGRRGLAGRRPAPGRRLAAPLARRRGLAGDAAREPEGLPGAPRGPTRLTGGLPGPEQN